MSTPAPWSDTSRPPVISTDWQRDELWRLAVGPACLLMRRDYRAWMDELAVTAAARLARNSPEGIAIFRATIAAHPYQQCLKANGCQHPCSCPKRNTSERNAP